MMSSLKASTLPFWLGMALATLLPLGCSGEKSEILPGTYQGEGVFLKIQPKDTGWVGDLRVGARSFPLEGKWTGQALTGFFGRGEARFPFTLKKDKVGFVLRSEGNTYHIVHVVPKNPLAKPKPAAKNPLAKKPKAPNPLGQAENPSPKGAPKAIPTAAPNPLKSGGGKVAPPPAATPGGKVSVSGRLYKHPLGFRFRYPDGWKIKETPDGVMLLPPDLKGGEEAFFMMGEKAPGITDVGDLRISGTLDQDLGRTIPFLKRKGPVKKLRLGGREFGSHQWEGVNPRGRSYVGLALGCLLEGYSLGVVGFMPKEQLAKRLPLLEAIAGSIHYKEPERDQAMVGVWRNEKYYSSGTFGSTTVRVLELRPDGTSLWRSRLLVSMEHKNAYGNSTGSTTGDTGKDKGLQGRWYAQKRKLVIQWANGRSEEYGYYREKNSLLLTPYGGGKKQLWQKIR